MGIIQLIYGEDLVQINTKKTELLDKFLPASQRPQNLIEFEPITNRFFLPLKSVMAELTAELNTEPFPPATQRVAIVHNLDILYKTVDEKLANSFLRFLKTNFAKSHNLLILIALHDLAKRRFLDKRGKIFAFINKKFPNNIHHLPMPSIIDRLYNAILSRKAGEAINALRQWARESKSPAPIFHSLLKLTELLIQAKIVAKKKSNGVGQSQIRQEFLPNYLEVNIFKEREKWQNKIMMAAEKFSFESLSRALDKLLEINYYLYPQQTDKFVPDTLLCLELFIIDLIGVKQKDASRI